MESAPMSGISDDREEGEIVDDDFEDISDNSIIVPIYSGKSVSSKEHLPAISLSSVTEMEEPRCEEKVKRRQKAARRRTSKSYKRQRISHRKSTCSDSDSDDNLVLDKKLQKQLKAAIRVDNGEVHKNSLRSRLRAMTKLGDSDSFVEKNCNGADKIESKASSDEGDTELTELRLEALRTAVINKFMHRKKRKVKEVPDNGILSDISIKTDTSETNKENAHNINENISAQDEERVCKKLCVEKSTANMESRTEIITNNVNENNTPPEDDEDVLRALLLASMSKKITKETDTKKAVLPPLNSNNRINDKIKHTNTKTLKNDTKTISVKNVTNFNVKRRVIKNNIAITNNQPVQIPKVKPLIINVNTDSDTDDELLCKTIKNVSIHQEIQANIDKEIENTVDKFLKEQRAKVEAELFPATNTPAKMNKSVIKLLPKETQLEYQTLLEKLKNAEKKHRIKRTTHKFNSDNKPFGLMSKKVIRTKVPVNKQVNNTPRIEQVPDVRSDARALHKIIKEIRIQKNGRLQIQEKYKTLTPIITKINQASTERKKYDEDVNRLLKELAEVKKKLHKSHQDFTAQVKELTKRKEEIDKRPGKPPVIEVPKTWFTSTPIKQLATIESFDGSILPATSVKSTKLHPESADTNVAPSVEIQKEDDIVPAPINPGDPNDIDKIYNMQRNRVSDYISPLDSVKRAVVDDPFSIVCPYDVDGNCRDKQCIYKHLFN